MSIEGKHTPGPWLAAARPSSVVGWPVVQPATGRSICSVTYVQHSKIDPPVPGDSAFNRESRANARLIAAAPELFEALQNIIPRFERAIIECGSDPEFAAAATEMHRRAIAKATGGEHA